MAIKVCASNPEKQVRKCECLLSHKSEGAGWSARAVEAWQGPRQTYLANAETEIFAPGRDNSQQKWKTLFPNIWQLAVGSPFSIFHPHFPPRVCLCLSAIPALESSLLPVPFFAPSFLFIFSKCIFVVQFQTASAILFRHFYRTPPTNVIFRIFPSFFPFWQCDKKSFFSLFFAANGLRWKLLDISI